MTEREILTAGLSELKIDSPQAVDKLLEFSTQLLEKNKVMNLTAVTDPLEVVTRHFLDSSVLSEYVAGQKQVRFSGNSVGVADGGGVFTAGFIEKAYYMAFGDDRFISNTKRKSGTCTRGGIRAPGRI